MGELIPAAIGAVGSLFGGSSAKKNDLTGYNYLTGSNGVGGIVNNGRTANNAETALLSGTANPTQIQGLGNYLTSNGYNFERNQGTAAITGSAAARGILNSGATAKALTQYGTNLANTNYNNYLTQLGGITNQGLTASGQIGQAGTAGGTAAGNAQQSGISSAFGQISGAVANNQPQLGNQLTNFFGGL